MFGRLWLPPRRRLTPAKEASLVRQRRAARRVLVERLHLPPALGQGREQHDRAARSDRWPVLVADAGDVVVKVPGQDRLGLEAGQGLAAPRVSGPGPPARDPPP